MHRLLLLGGLLIACLFAATIAQALTVGYGQRDITQSGPGCVGGWVSEHGNTGYFRGDTELLNSHLARLAAETARRLPARVVLHAGKKLVDNPEEQPITGLGTQGPDQLPIDWCVRKSCPSDDVFAGDCKCDRRIVTVDIWIANDIRLDALTLPPGFSVESGREIEQFIKERAERE